MECRVCRRNFTTEITFSTLFMVFRICPDCQKKYQPGWHRERIPIQNAICDYIRIYPFENQDFQQGIWLYRYMDKCFKLAIYAQYCYDLILFIEDTEYLESNDWFHLLAGFGNILMFSLFSYDFSIVDSLG
jgi:hypothetical protein